MFQVRPSALTFIKKETPTQVCKIFKNNFFIEHLQWMLLKYQVPSHCRVNETYSLTIRHRKVTVLLLQSGKNSILKFHDHNFLARCAFFKAPFFGLPYLSISSGVFFMCHFCKVALFSNHIKECHFCWVYLMVVKL